MVPTCPPGYNVADYLLEIASDPPVALFNLRYEASTNAVATSSVDGSHYYADAEKEGIISTEYVNTEKMLAGDSAQSTTINQLFESSCATTFLTQFQVLSGREWKILQRYGHIKCQCK